MEIFYDFHIHSALSPCGDNDMTPNNIVNMAMIKGLDFIAVSDHNSAKNIPAIAKCAQAAGIGFLPGIELNTAEEVHLLGYFLDADTAFEFGEVVYEALPNVKNMPDFFGNQYIMDENDEIVGEVDKLLISALPWSFDESVKKIIKYGGIAVPAHINKNANSVMSNLGFMPENDFIFAAETSEKGEKTIIDSKRYNIITSSDAHYLQDISEKIHKITLNTEKADTQAIFDYLKTQNI